MSRLIDADKLIKQLDDDIKITEKYVERSIKKNDNDGYIRYSNQLNTLQSYRLIIKDMKTAFDVDKVVKKLEVLKDLNHKEWKKSSWTGEEIMPYLFAHNSYVKAIKIVKAGGIE